LPPEEGAREELQKCTAHLGAHSMHAPGFLPALGGNPAMRSEALADVGMVALAVELRISQRWPDARLFRSCCDKRRQIRTVV